MKLSLYMSEDTIRVVEGTARAEIYIKSCGRYELPPGTLINGVITDLEALQKVLLSIKMDYPAYRNRIHLILGSRAFTKVMQIPFLTERRICKRVEEELKYFSSETEDVIYDYSVIRRRNRDGRTGTILCAALERSLVEEYRDLFSSVGMKIKTMDTALNATVHMAEYFTCFKRKTCILSILDGRNMMSTLFVNGVYYYTSRLRLLSDRTSSEIYDEVVRELNAVIRFQSFQELGKEIKVIYLCGLNREEEEEAFPKISRETGIPVKAVNARGRIRAEFGSQYRMGDFFYATGNLIER